jgi:hypothetical protein
MRPSKENQILKLLSLNRDGFLWRDLIGRHAWSEKAVNEKIKRGEIYLPRKTLDRNLKKMIEKGIVEKILAPRKPGQRGRQAYRYRIAPKYWHSWGCLCLTIPAKKIGKVWFPGRMIERLGKPHVRLTGKWLKDYMEHRAWLKEHEPQEYEKLLKIEREKKLRDLPH